MKNVCFDSCILIENKLWFVTKSTLFMYYDVVKERISLVEPFIDKTFFLKNVLDSMLYYEGNIFWVEQDGKRLLQYNIKNNELYTYMMPHVDYIDWTCFSGVYLIGAAIYFIPRYTPNIIIFDIVSKTFSVRNNVFSSFKICEDRQIVRKTVLYDDLLLVGSCDAVVAYSIGTKGIEKKWSNNIEKDLFDLVYDGDGLWVLYKDCVVEKYVNGQKAFDTKVQSDCYLMLNTGKKIFLLPGIGGKIYSIDKLSNELTVVGCYPEDFLALSDAEFSKFYTYYDSSTEFILPLRRTSTLLLIDKENGRLSWRKMPQMSEDLSKAIMNYNRTHSIANVENDKNYLDIFISYVKNEA